MNEGKKFEKQFKSSIPSYCLVHRLRDSSQSYNNSIGTTFSWDNECDFFLFDSKKHIFYTLELKSTKFKTMNFQCSKDDKTSKMIKYHQLESLRKFSKYDGVTSGLILNFRDEEHQMERTYFQNIIYFDQMVEEINKKSFNEIDLLMHNAIKINGVKKRVNYIWDIESFLNI